MTSGQMFDRRSTVEVLSERGRGGGEVEGGEMVLLGGGRRERESE